MVNRRRTDNIMVNRRRTDNIMVNRRRTDNIMVNRRRTDNINHVRAETLDYSSDDTPGDKQSTSRGIDSVINRADKLW
jgi:hypothetical protein